MVTTGITWQSNPPEQLLNAALQGIYFAFFAFSDLRKQLGLIQGPVPGNIILLFFFLPILCWLISLYCATRS